MCAPESSPVDSDLRVVRYSVGVAEERHFGRTAAGLRITHPSLSGASAGLERLLGVVLLHRAATGAELTDAGHVFIPKARRLLNTSGRAICATWLARGV